MIEDRKGANEMTIEAAFLGTIARAELKMSQAGRQYLRFSCRVGDGESSQWVSVVSFDAEAIAVAEKFVKGARVYVEGHGLKIDKWTGQDGTEKTGLSCMSGHTRLAAIGANRPKRDGDAAPDRRGSQRAHANEIDDEIGF
jgi:single-stranded DNA-binding protein